VCVCVCAPSLLLSEFWFGNATLCRCGVIRVLCSLCVRFPSSSWGSSCAVSIRRSFDDVAQDMRLRVCCWRDSKICPQRKCEPRDCQVFGTLVPVMAWRTCGGCRHTTNMSKQRVMLCTILYNRGPGHYNSCSLGMMDPDNGRELCLYFHVKIDEDGS
jgi:hypothetical protein